MDAANAQAAAQANIQNVQQEQNAAVDNAVNPRKPTSKTSAACKRRGAVSDEAIPAATLILVRERSGGPPELLMVERAGGMAFAAGALVFPGGRIDEADRQLGGELGVDAGGRRCDPRDASRKRRSRSGFRPCPMQRACAELQDALVADRPFGELLDEHGLRLDAAALTPFARWVPKFHAVRRFDTLFFIARCSAGDWEPRVIEGECPAAAWITGGRGAGARRTRRSAARFSRRAEPRTARAACRFERSAPMRSRTRSSR